MARILAHIMVKLPRPVHLKITMGAALREVVGECLRSPLVSPYLIHYKPKARRREQIDAKDHWTSVTPDYLPRSSVRPATRRTLMTMFPPVSAPLFTRSAL